MIQKMVSIDTLQAEAKRDLTNNILEEMENYLNNSQLMELNRSINTNLDSLQVYKHHNINTDYEERNKELIEEFIRVKKLKGLSPNTLNAYSNELNKFREYSCKLLIDYKPEDLREYLTFRQQLENCSNVTLNNYRRILSTFYKHLEVEEYILRNPMKAVGHIKEPKRIKKPFTDEEIEKLRNALYRDYDYRDIAIFELLLSSGIRLSECEGLDIDDIDFDSRTFTVIGKGNKERLCYFGTKAKLALEDYLIVRSDDNPALFVTINQPYKRLGKSGIGTMIRDLGRYVDVECHPHKFRRTLATKLNRREVPLEQIQKILGHNNINTTLIYTSVDQDDLKLNYAKNLK